MALDMRDFPWRCSAGHEVDAEHEECPVCESTPLVCVGFTGTQQGMTRAQYLKVNDLLLELRPEEAHHGMCVGADCEFNEIATGYAIFRVGWPGTDARGISPKRGDCAVSLEMPAAPYLVRNRCIVESSTVLIATPGEMTEQIRSGTWSTVRYAGKFGIPVTVVLPDGSVQS